MPRRKPAPLPEPHLQGGLYSVTRSDGKSVLVAASSEEEAVAIFNSIAARRPKLGWGTVTVDNVHQILVWGDKDMDKTAKNTITLSSISLPIGADGTVSTKGAVYAGPRDKAFAIWVKSVLAVGVPERGSVISSPGAVCYQAERRDEMFVATLRGTPVTVAEIPLLLKLPDGCDLYIRELSDGTLKRCTLTVQVHEKLKKNGNPDTSRQFVHVDGDKAWALSDKLPEWLTAACKRGDVFRTALSRPRASV